MADVRKSIDFYIQALSYKLGNTSEQAGAICWAHIRYCEIELILTEVASPEADREGRRQTHLYFYPDNVAALHSHLSAEGMQYNPCA